MTGVQCLTVMHALLLTTEEGDAAGVVAQRVRLRDRFAARVRTVSLDRDLAAGVPPEAGAALTLRARALIGPSTRRALVQGVLLVMSRARAGEGLNARIPVCRHKVMTAAQELDALANRLLEPGPVAARGVAQVRLLLCDGTGPLYDRCNADDLGIVLRQAIEGLEPPG
jgi:hypothetical protein